MTLKIFTLSVVLPGLFEGPGGYLRNTFHDLAIIGQPEGRHAFVCSGTRTALPQTEYQIAVRTDNRIKIAGLPLAFPELIAAHVWAVAVPKHIFRLHDEDRCAI